MRKEKERRNRGVIGIIQTEGRRGTEGRKDEKNEDKTKDHKKNKKWGIRKKKEK